MWRPPSPTYTARMKAGEAPDAVDTRLVLRAYAAVAITAGLAVYCWPAALLPAGGFPAATPEAPWALTRVMAALVAASGACAWALADVADPVSRVQALRALGLAHLVFGGMFFIQWLAILERVLPAVVGVGPIVAGSVLFYLAVTQQSDTGGRSLETLRSQYEEQIEEAARHEERVRLARDLHDAVKQQLFAIQASAATVEARFAGDPAGAQAALAQVRASAREATIEMETLIEQLQTAPLETTGLRDALKRQGEALAFRTGADVQVAVGDLPPDMWLPPGAQRALFRGAQEALANVGRHARARHVTVRLGTEGDQLVLEIADDGAGFEPGRARAGMGLENMHERARALGGTFVLTSAPGDGTTARFIVPLEHQSMREYAAKAFLWLTLLALNLGLWNPFRFTAAVVCAVAAVALIRCIVAIVKLHRAGATWR
jgi:signal transduction histidine kinase